MRAEAHPDGGARRTVAYRRPSSTFSRQGCPFGAAGTVLHGEILRLLARDDLFRLELPAVILDIREARWCDGRHDGAPDDRS